MRVPGWYLHRLVWMVLSILEDRLNLVAREIVKGEKVNLQDEGTDNLTHFYRGGGRCISDNAEPCLR